MSGLKAARVAIEEGRSVRLRIRPDSGWIEWDPREMRWRPIDATEPFLHMGEIVNDDLEIIFGAPVARLTFAEAVAAMDRGETVQRFEGTCHGAMVMRWRRDGAEPRYVRQYLTGEWKHEAFNYDDVHATDWTIVSNEDPRKADDRPTVAEVKAYWQGVAAQMYITRLEDVGPAVADRLMIDLLANRWPGLFREEDEAQ